MERGCQLIARLFIPAAVVLIGGFREHAVAQVTRCSDSRDDLIRIAGAADPAWGPATIAPRMVRVRQWGSELGGFQGEATWCPLAIDHTTQYVAEIVAADPANPSFDARPALVVDCWQLTIGQGPVVVLPGPGLVTVDVWRPYGVDGSGWYQVMGFRHEPRSGESLPWCWATLGGAGLLAGVRRQRR